MTGQCEVLIESLQMHFLTARISTKTRQFSELILFLFLCNVIKMSFNLSGQFKSLFSPATDYQELSIKQNNFS